MIQISPSASASKPASRPALLASGGTPAFARALKTALAPGAKEEAEGETPAIALGVRQKPAGDGKDLPDAPEGDAEETGDAGDVAFAWFGAALVLPQPAPALPRLPVAANAIQLPEGRIAPAIAAARPSGGPLSVDVATLDPAAPGPDAPEAAAPVAPPIELSAPAAPAPRIEAPIAIDAPTTPGRPAGPARIELPPAQDQAARIQPITLAAIQPRAEAIQPLAAPLAAAAIEAPAPRRAGPRETAVPALSMPTADAPRPHAVPATADAQQPALDTRRHEWMNAMVERIEALRDSSGSRETSIRLSPDALGTVDIAIRHEGDRVHVRFTAETPAARAALAEAQPRLAELAEARGLRLGQTSVDGGAAGQGQRHDAAPRPAFNVAPANAPGDETATDTHDRIA